ncbi:hypothetical protein ABB02_01116 [Clostridiaceae bacterium JG1575]|nr:hypothetical protein ABB02_01116 [Clostridiaceae bacterium JG1575]
MNQQYPGCDPDLGCTTPHPAGLLRERAQSFNVDAPRRSITLFYITDPICCYCWQLEPVLRKLLSLYGHLIDYRIVMGGLLPSWDNFSDSANGIHQANEVGAHWREAAGLYGMPSDGSLWPSDPILSSYPASLAFKQVQKISKTSASRFLRSVREEALVFNRNVGRDDVLVDILNRLDRNGKMIVADSQTEEARRLLEEDLSLSSTLGASAFPTLVFVNSEGDGIRLQGMKEFEEYERVLTELLGEEPESDPLPELSSLFSYSRNVFFRELEVLYDLEKEAIAPFVAYNLPSDTYEIRSILGESYIIRK